MNKKKDIMDNILVGHGDEFASRVEELNCLIYKSGHESMDEDREGRVWQASKDNVSVQVWESKAKIKVNVSSLNKKTISMKRIADVAVNAILEELKKED
ncbi:MAG: hypothetical protein A2097_02195 [Desulfobacula sp. GWF2_41_7]|nr:MAG: hypothetical protein A2097_02195 [Desulfobacula sp. GWF2_41_7]